jgi:ADP-heptose:LPS heptosyltransferase
MRDIASERYTHVIDLRGDGWTLLLPFLSGATIRLDRGTVRLRSWMNRRAIGLRVRRAAGSHGAPMIPAHEVETNLAVVRPIVGSSTEGEPRIEIFISDSDRAALEAKLRGLGIQEDDLIVSIHPGASWRPRAWFPERFAEVARQLLERHPISVIFVGGEEDRDIAERIRPLAPSPRVHFLFGSRLAEAAALMERSALFIGSDSGLAHIAAACGTSVVALFGPQDPMRFRPWSPHAIVLHKPVHCFPCRQTTCVHPELPCVNLISVEDVMERAETFLVGSVQGRPQT